MNSNHQAPLLKVKHNICSWNCQHNSNTRGKIKTHLRGRHWLLCYRVTRSRERGGANGRPGSGRGPAEPQVTCQKGETMKPSTFRTAVSSNVWIYLKGWGESQPAPTLQEEAGSTISSRLSVPCHGQVVSRRREMASSGRMKGNPNSSWQAPTGYLHSHHLTAPTMPSQHRKSENPLLLPCPISSPAPQHAQWASHSSCGFLMSQDVLDELLCCIAWMPALMAKLKRMA